MASAYVVGPIDASQIERAYCLVSAVGYDIDVDGWRQVCATNLLRNYPSPYVEDIVVVEDPRGYVRGIAILRARHSERLGRYLSVPVFASITAADARGVCETLLRYIRTAARKKQCNAIHIASLRTNRWPVGAGETEMEFDGILIPLR
ncbi:hypothetical protein IB267_31255 [Ensifer sp. ENS09]|uniref:hypothetical protein n=1 Tax=Ensifer sp. ENS09 TaxID=2769263 RepID=UPI001784791E|nr:hypothetical protein [Ensifer sp. ENS09]MBD9652851.1 hypothetical protein [Ensifer sp. ENS09]